MSFDPEHDHRLSGWMQKAQDGDRESYKNLLQEVEVILKPFLGRRLRSSEAVEDVTQEILISIHSSRHTYDPKHLFGPWMYGIARNRVADYWRKQFKRMQNEIQIETEPIDTPASPVTNSDPLSEKINLALERLPHNQQQIIRLLKVEGFSIKETSARLKMSESAIKVTAHRAYKKLKKEFLSEAYEND